MAALLRIVTRSLEARAIGKDMRTQHILILKRGAVRSQRSRQEQKLESLWNQKNRSVRKSVLANFLVPRNLQAISVRIIICPITS